MTATTDAQFSLRSLVRQVAAENGLMPPGQLAQKVAAQVPDAHLREVLEQVLGPYVRQVMSEERPKGPAVAANGPSRPAAPSVVPVTFRPPAPSAAPARPPAPTVPARPTAPATPAAAAAPNPAKPAPVVSSRKGAEIRDGWQRHLEATYPVKDGYKKLGDCTRADLHYLAEIRDKQADSLKAHARYFRALAALLADHDAATIRDLPAQVQMQAVGSK